MNRGSQPSEFRGDVVMILWLAEIVRSGMEMECMKREGRSWLESGIGGVAAWAGAQWMLSLLGRPERPTTHLHKVYQSNVMKESPNENRLHQAIDDEDVFASISPTVQIT